ncbi:hypothetical protein [Pyxidicoccus sp. MSG2]|uniref:hypothetical protein n=1 Tax=Pyxidicoccus sp. MSG2 TaxID=2996790 RepID=UPI00226ECFBD|nr:hypothetical protein [Pyxidicoccus sp. MSG2]MCY1022178.1 hypothetical protein [Pyxidicoccus sp. MSG2]
MLDVGKNRPWALGVAPGDQQTAQALFQEGNERLKESFFVEASRHYRQALQHWNHPAIHYNLALALMNLDQPVEVHEHLVAAMRHGPEPLDVNRFEHALDYRKLLEQQLTWVDVSCDQADTTVTMDGQLLFIAPGRFQGLMRPGMHSLVALKKGYMTTEKTPTLMPGKREQFALKVYTASELTEYRRRWAAWIPWTVMGSGLAVAAGGGLLHQQARARFNTFDEGVNQCGGCIAKAELMRLHSQGAGLQKAAVAAYAVGGAALTTGVLMLYFNRAQPHLRSPRDVGQEVVVTPLVGTGAGGVLGAFRF